MTNERNDLVEQALDLFVYAPLGLAFAARELIPTMAKKGREQVMTARAIGQFAVTMGQQEVSRRLRSINGGRPQPAAQPAPQTSAAPAPARPAEPAVNRPSPGAPAEVTSAIPGYDALSASQVVPRLAGLTPAELEAVRSYEESGRGRKTVLSRIAQLQAG